MVKPRQPLCGLDFFDTAFRILESARGARAYSTFSTFATVTSILLVQCPVVKALIRVRFAILRAEGRPGLAWAALSFPSTHSSAHRMVHREDRLTEPPPPNAFELAQGAIELRSRLAS